jgi:CO/xanthine dehydrogenase FAD-binding subunit
MAILKAYHRPTSADAALMLLSRRGVTTALIAGGTAINARRDADVEEIVDLQAAGLDELHRAGDRLTVGAMVRLQTLVDSPEAPDLLRDAVHREGPNTFRHAGTIGGAIVVADWESELLAALLVLDSDINVQTPQGHRVFGLAEFLEDVPKALDGGLITSITLGTTGATASDRVGRTPADKPIVAATARRDLLGRIHLGLSGVAPTPILVDVDKVVTLDPPADFRGSSAYRREMAVVLSKRVLAALA